MSRVRTKGWEMADVTANPSSFIANGWCWAVAFLGDFHDFQNTERNERVYLPRLANSPVHAYDGAQAMGQLEEKLLKYGLDWGTDEKKKREGEGESGEQEMIVDILY